jgi:hypothetical protein
VATHSTPPARRLRPRLLALGIVAALLAACAGTTTPSKPATAPVTLKIVGAGGVLTQHVGTEPAPKTLQGSVNEVPTYWTPEFTSPPDAVRAKLGTSMGMEVLVQGPEFLTVVSLRTRVTHPPITDPHSGRTVTVDEWESPMNAGFPRFTGWAFEHEWELVPGTWKIEMVLDGRVAASQTFQVSLDGNG